MPTGGAEVEGAFRALYDRTHQQVMAYCLRRSATRADALDAMADTYVVAWRRWAEIPEGDGGLLWLFATARRVMANARRSDHRRGRLTQRLRTAGLPAQTPEESTAASEEHRDVLRALERLSNEDQELLRLTTFEELPHADVASLLGISRNAVDVRLHRARRRLAVEYEKVRGRGRAATGKRGESDG